MKAVSIFFCLVFIILVHYSFAYFFNRPYTIETPPPSGKLKSLSFAPYREGYSPASERYPLPEHVEGDLQVLVDKTESIRTYTSQEGLEQTPEFARKYGVNLIQGAWLVNDHVKNHIEIQALIKSANAYPDVVKRVIVGNEVMLHHYMDVKQLIGYIREVKAAIKQPVSYADVWSMYLKYPELISEVDYITIHILPYWEDEPIPVEHATAHLEKIFKQIEAKVNSIAPGKAILIGESGWPAAGRQRGQAVPSVINAARYISDLANLASGHGFDYNIVEAFNQPWKSADEGVVGANWGLFNVARKPVFPITGEVYNNPNWSENFIMSTGLWLVVVATTLRKQPINSLLKLLVFLGLAQLTCAALVSMADGLWSTSYSLFQRGYAIFIVTANLLLGALLIRRYHDMLSSASLSVTLGTWLGKAYLYFIYLALFKSFALAIDGGKLSFPWQEFAILTLGVPGLIVCAWLQSGKLLKGSLSNCNLFGFKLSFAHDRKIACLLGAATLALVLGETKNFLEGNDLLLAHPGFFNALPFALKYTLTNQQLLLWLASLIVISIPYWFSKHQNQFVVSNKSSHQ